MLIEIALGVLVTIAAGATAHAAWRATRSCPACHASHARWLYQRLDGRRDLRYSFNPLFCPRCGWSSNAALDDASLSEGVRPALTLGAAASGDRGGGTHAVPVAIRHQGLRGATPEETHHIAAALERLARQKGPGARRQTLHDGLRVVTSRVGQQTLIDHAARVEVHTVLEQTAAMPKKRRHKNLQAALARLHQDAHDDVLQSSAIEILRRVLDEEKATLDLPPPNER